MILDDRNLKGITRWAKIYLMVIILFFGIDLFWLALISNNIYSQEIGFLLSTHINWWAAFTFYLLYVVGMCYFVISPSIQKLSPTTALGSGMLFGLTTYGTYDLTNLATIDGWPLKIVIIDMIWGAFITGIVSCITVYFQIKRNKNALIPK